MDSVDDEPIVLARPPPPEPPAPQPGRPSRIALAVAPAVILVIVAVWEVVATFAAARSVPDAECDDWKRAAAAVRAQAKPGDLIVFAPRWLDPVGRMHLGDLIPLDVAGRMDSARFARIWEISALDASAPEARGAAVVSSRHFGKLRVRQLEQTPAVVVTDFVGKLGEARLENGSALAILDEVGFEPHRCIRITPPAGGSARVVFPAAALGSRLVGYVGIADIFTRREIREPIRLDVLIAGVKRASVSAGVDSGWVRFETPTTPGTAEVVFEAAAPSPQAHGRLVCFAAEARK